MDTIGMDSDEQTSLWKGLAWGKQVGLKSALALRGIPHQKYPSRRQEREDFINKRIASLVDWYSILHSKGHSPDPPELRSNSELADDLRSYDYEEFAGLVEEQGDQGPCRRKAIQILVDEHCALMLEPVSTTEEDDEEDSEEETPDSEQDDTANDTPQEEPPSYEEEEPFVEVGTVVYSNPEGLIGAKYAGKNRLFFPHEMGETTARIPKVVRDSYGKVMATYAHTSNEFLRKAGLEARLDTEEYTVITQSCDVITGVMDGGTKGDFDLELLRLIDKSLTKIDPSTLAFYPTFPSLEDAFEYATTKIGNNTDAEPCIVLVHQPHFDLEEGIVPMLELPKLLDEEGRDLARVKGPVSPSRSPGESHSKSRKQPHQEKRTPEVLHASFVNAREEELEAKCQQLQNSVMKCLKHPTEALAKRQEMSPVETDEDRCLVTGKPYPRGITDVEKLDVHSVSQFTSGQDPVCGMCLICTEDAVEHRRATDLWFDDSNYDQVSECFAYEKVPGANNCSKCRGLKGKTQPLHPHPWLPSRCSMCRIPIMCNGEIRTGCTKCPYSYIMPASDSAMMPRKAGSSSEALAEYRNKVLMYVLSFGGGSSELLGHTVDVYEAQTKLLRLALSTGKGGKGYAITPRIAWYGPLLATGSSPLGSNGLVPSDFQEFTLDLLHDDPKLAHFSADMSGEELRKAVEKHYPLAPLWESSGAKSKSYEKLVIKDATVNEGLFWTSLIGPKWGNDTANVPIAIFRKLMPSSLGSSCTMPTLLHTIVLTYHSWTSRIKEQLSDLTTDRMWHCEKLVGMCIRLFYSPNLPEVLLRSTLAMRGQEDHDREVSFYMSDTLDGSVYDEKGRQEIAAKKKKEKEDQSKRFREKKEEEEKRKKSEESAGKSEESQKRRHEQAARDRKSHEDKKNQEGTGVGTPAPAPLPKAKEGEALGKGGAKGGGRGQGNTSGDARLFPTGETDPSLDPNVLCRVIQPPMGQLQGERALRMEKWNFCIPVHACGKRYCPKFHTKYGCSDNAPTK